MASTADSSHTSGKMKKEVTITDTSATRNGVLTLKRRDVLVSHSHACH